MTVNLRMYRTRSSSFFKQTTSVSIISLIYFLLLCFNVSGQSYYANTRMIGTKDGLSHYKVLSLLSSDEGMWIGTEDGLNHYNGYNWKYWSKDEGDLRHKSVNFIKEDQTGILWLFATKKVADTRDVLGITLLFPQLDSTISIQDYFGDKLPFALEDIQHFFSGPDQKLFFTANGQTWTYTPEQGFQVLKIPQDFVPHSLLKEGIFAGKLKDHFAIASSSGQIIWASDYYLKQGPYQVIGDEKQFLIWQEGALCKKFEQGQEGQYQAIEFPIQQHKKDYFSLICVDNSHQGFWINSGNKIYLCSYDGSLIFQHDSPVRTAILDQNDNLWIGKYELKLLQLKEQKFQHYLYTDTPLQVPNNRFECRGILEKDGLLYVNTYQGAKIIDLHTGNLQATIDIPARTFTILEDYQSNLWMAHRELYQLDPSGKKTIAQYHYYKDETPRIWSTYEDQANRIWLGHVGISYFEDGQLKPFDQYNEYTDLANALILFFFKDKNGVIWLGSNDGLYQLDLQKGIVGHYGKNAKGRFWLPSSKFQHMYQDTDGVFWLATGDTGLIRWDKANGQIDQFGKGQGMSTNNIYSVYEDDFGTLWMSSFAGIIRFDKSTKKTVIYYEKDGITCNEFNRISHHQSKEGTIYFGSQNGVTAFHPKDFAIERKDTLENQLFIKHISAIGLKANYDTLKNGQQINLSKLSPDIRVIDLELSLSDIFASNQVHFYYTLEEFSYKSNSSQKSKEYLSVDNHIQLFGINPGKYNLVIKAALLNGELIAPPMEIPIVITRPYFHQPWFWAGLSLILAIAIWVVIKTRERRLKNREIELTKLAEKRAAQIVQDQKLIASQSKQIEDMQNQLNRKDILWLEQFKGIVNDRLADPDLYLPAIISDMDISRSVFYEKVKSLTQMTPNQYIQELRLNKAKGLLDEGKAKTVKAAASAVGISRPSYFSKLFKERFGILPSTYFRDNRN